MAGGRTATVSATREGGCRARAERRDTVRRQRGHALGRDGRRDRRRIRRGRIGGGVQCGRCGGPGAGRRADRWPRRRRGTGRGHRVPRGRDADSDRVRLRGLPRRHVPLHDGGLWAGSERGQNRPLLRGEPGALRLAGGAGRALRPHLLRRHLHGTGRHRGTGLLRRRGRLPVQRHRPSGAPWSPGQDEALDRMAPHAAPGRRRDRGGRGGLDRHRASTAWSATRAGSSACRRSGSARR